MPRPGDPTGPGEGVRADLPSYPQVAHSFRTLRDADIRRLTSNEWFYVKSIALRCGRAGLELSTGHSASRSSCVGVCDTWLASIWLIGLGITSVTSCGASECRRFSASICRPLMLIATSALAWP